MAPIGQYSGNAPSLTDWLNNNLKKRKAEGKPLEPDYYGVYGSDEATGGFNANAPDLGEGAGGGVGWPYEIPQGLPLPSQSEYVPPKSKEKAKKVTEALPLPTKDLGTIVGAPNYPDPVKTKVPIPKDFNPYSGNFYKNIASMLPAMAQLAVESGKRKAGIQDLFAKQKLQQGEDIAARNKMELEALPLKKQVLEAQIKQKGVDPFRLEAMKAYAKELPAAFAAQQAADKKAGKKESLTWNQFLIAQGIDAGGATLPVEPSIAAKTETE